MHRAEAILQFWFEGVNDHTPIKSKLPPFKHWFSAHQEFDQLIRDQFLHDYEKAQKGEYASWKESSAGKLALILIFDQFSRNMFRGTPKMFETDNEARDLSHAIINAGENLSFKLIERSFIYMPLMHTEDLSIQKESVRCFTKLLDDCARLHPYNVPYYKNQLKYAQNHFETIAHFGRFPHRNHILNRESTLKETQFLKTK